jgi:hypothetical protein
VGAGPARPAAAAIPYRRRGVVGPVHRRPTYRADPARSLVRRCRLRCAQLAGRSGLPTRVVPCDGAAPGWPRPRDLRLPGRHVRRQLLRPARRDRGHRRRHRRRAHPRRRRFPGRDGGGRLLPGHQPRPQRDRRLGGLPGDLARASPGKPGGFPDSTDGADS